MLAFEKRCGMFRLRHRDRTRGQASMNQQLDVLNEGPARAQNRCPCTSWQPATAGAVVPPAAPDRVPAGRIDSRRKALMSLKIDCCYPLCPGRRAAAVAAPAESSRAAELDAGARYRQELNVPFPTVDGGSELLNVYMPVGDPPAGGWPVLVAIHGGGWRRLDKDGYGARIASAFVQHGYVVVAPNYVLSKPGQPTWPVNLEDVQAAVSWVRENAGALGIDPDEIAAIGESAGANLAALVGTSSGPGAGNSSSAVEAVVGFSTPTDLTALSAPGRVCRSAVPGWNARTGTRQLCGGIADRSCRSRGSADVFGAGPARSFDTLQSINRDGGRAFGGGGSESACPGQRGARSRLSRPLREI